MITCIAAIAMPIFVATTEMRATWLDADRKRVLELHAPITGKTFVWIYDDKIKQFCLGTKEV